MPSVGEGQRVHGREVRLMTNHGCCTVLVIKIMYLKESRKLSYLS